MRVFPFVAALLLLLAAGCGERQLQPDHQAEWREVLEHKKAASARGATADHKQTWADSVRTFVQHHPDHERAREVWQRLQLEFADDLSSHGRYQQAIVFYRAVLAHDPANEQALRGLETAAGRLVVPREKLAQVRPGMREREVAAMLGRPMPGWSRKVRRRSATFEAWYYRTARGIAAVHFREGKVIVAEETSSARVGKLGV